MRAGIAIVGLLSLIGVSVYFFERVATIASSGKTYQEVKLENIHTVAMDEPFLLTGFHYRKADFERLDGRHVKAMALYLNPNDSIARIGIEVNKKDLFRKEMEEYGKIRVEPDGGMWELPTYQGVKLFGYSSMSKDEIEVFKQQAGIDKFDEGIDRGVVYRYVPTETFAGSRKEIIGFSILIVFLFFSTINDFRASIKKGEWGMKRKTISLIIFFIIPLGLMGQYVCYDEDGYTNVRKGPGTQYEIIDKVSKYEVFYSSNWLCEGGEDLDNSLTWIPFARSIYDSPDEKFIFRKNVRSLDEMPVIRCRRSDNDGNRTLVCANDTVSINLVQKNFDVKNHIVETTDLDGERRVKNIDGKWPKGFFLIPEEELPKQKEISELYIVKGNKRIDLPIDAIKEYFNTWAMSVYLGYNGELYIWITVGDASEAYGICLSVVDESIKFTLEWSSC